MPTPTLCRIHYRGSTVEFEVTFYDPDDNVVQPPSAQVNIVYPLSAGGTGDQVIAMVPPISPDVDWTAEWDSRVAAPGTVFYSVKSGAPVPIGVADGSFALSANVANVA